MKKRQSLKFNSKSRKGNRVFVVNIEFLSSFLYHFTLKDFVRVSYESFKKPNEHFPDVFAVLVFHITVKMCAGLKSLLSLGQVRMVHTLTTFDTILSSIFRMFREVCCFQEVRTLVNTGSTHLQRSTIVSLAILLLLLAPDLI